MRPRILIATAVAGLPLALLAAPSAQAAPPTAAGQAIQVSADPYTNSGPQHATEVEPDTAASGRTVVSVFQVGRWDNGCSDDIGWATSHNGGTTWKNGFLPGLTAFSQPRGPYFRASDPSIAYNAKFGEWVASSLPCNGDSADPNAYVPDPGITVNLSSNGTTWGNAIVVASVPLIDQQFGTDKNWVTCDNSPSSPFYGNCYMEWDVVADQLASGDLVMMSTSIDGGKTWSQAVGTSDGLHATGGEPVVEPDGTVVVPIQSQSGIVAFRSTDGGGVWGPAMPVASISRHRFAGGLRGPSFHSVTINSAGTIYISWPDCRFRTGCTSNDMVMTSSSDDGLTWTPVQRIPIDPVTSTVDHLGGGLGVDPATTGSSARLGLFYYFYPDAACTAATCQLEVGYVSSANGGSTWSTPQLVAGPMSLAQLAQAPGGMVGDYVGAAVIPGGNAFAAFAVGATPAGSQAFNEGMYEPFRGEPITGGAVAADSAGVQPGLSEASMPGITR